LTNITWDMVKDAPTFDRIASRVIDILSGKVFVAHNAPFDWKFVSTEVRRASGTSLYGRRLCTVKLARQVLPQLSRRSLDYVANYYGVEITARHRAGGDALATAGCLIRLLNDAADRGCTTWQELDLLLGARTARRKGRRFRAMPAPVTKDTTS
ncbi:MAG TPA: 3'-5' exonuclease, partial [Gemmatimonadaceae bacterium]|nr:3'-5' exonuclease [Gemmatimonadaceae bacterium]